MIKILIEGPDGHGKSRLMNDLVEAFEGRIIGVKYPTRPVTRDDIDNRIKHLLFSIVRCTQKEILVWDRHAIVSEMVYGPILRKHTIVPIAYLKTALDSFIMQPKNIFVICLTTAKIDDIEVKYRKFSMFKDLVENYPAIVKAYYDILLNTPLAFHYDWKDPDSFARLLHLIGRVTGDQYYECE